MATPNYDINYDDKRFTQVTTEKTEALTDLENTYGGMISDSDKFYKDQIQASKDYAAEQTANQNAQTKFTIEQINQQKQQAKEDYTKEQSGAYVDWQKQSNAYGANAEAMAAQGLQNTGFSESSQVSLYNTYQQRYVAAREAYSRAVLNYDNAIKEARLQNSSILAEIAYNALQQQLTLSLEGFQYKNTLLLDKVEKKTQLDQMYHQRWQDVLAQINEENKLKETVRQHEDTMAFNREKEKNDKAYRDAQLALEREKFAWEKAQAGGSGGGGNNSKNDPNDNINRIEGGQIKTDYNSKPETKIEGKELKVDTDSLIAAGFAGKSAKSINDAVERGELIETEKNGTLIYRRNPNYFKIGGGLR